MSAKKSARNVSASVADCGRTPFSLRRALTQPGGLLEASGRAGWRCRGCAGRADRGEGHQLRERVRALQPRTLRRRLRGAELHHARRGERFPGGASRARAAAALSASPRFPRRTAAQRTRTTRAAHSGQRGSTRRRRAKRNHGRFRLAREMRSHCAECLGRPLCPSRSSLRNSVDTRS